MFFSSNLLSNEKCVGLLSTDVRTHALAFSLFDKQV